MHPVDVAPLFQRLQGVGHGGGRDVEQLGQVTLGEILAGAVQDGEQDGVPHLLQPPGGEPGVDGAAVTWGFRSEEQLRAAGAKNLFDTAEALGEYILQSAEGEEQA